MSIVELRSVLFQAHRRITLHEIEVDFMSQQLSDIFDTVPMKLDQYTHAPHQTAFEHKHT